MIPKIIHHIAPVDKDKHHPLWEPCYNSWKKLSDYQFIQWNDDSDIDNLVKTDYPQYYELYKSFPFHIMRIDFSRFCILHKYGGVYADMDMFCYKDFSPILELNDMFLLEAPWGDVPIENALMASTPNNDFFLQCMEMSKQNFDNIKDIDKNWTSDKNRQAILMCAGPGIVDKVARQYKGNIGIFHGDLFNNHGLSYHPQFFTKHVMTGMWGEDTWNHIEETKNTDKSTKEVLKDLYMKEINKYVDMKGITFDSFDFYVDYTENQFLKRLNIFNCLIGVKQ